MRRCAAGNLWYNRAMEKKTELYRPGDPGTLKKKYDASLAAVWTVAAAALAACVLFCVFTNTANALRMEMLAVAAFTVGGWVVIYLLTFVTAALKHEEEHATRILAGERTAVRGRVRLEKRTIRIRKSISVRTATVTDGGESRRLYVDACRARELERALAGGEKLCELDVVGGYLAAFAVCHENS